MGKIAFNYNNVPPIPGNKRNLKSSLINVLAAESVDLDKISYIFCTDKYLLNLNIKYLNHNTFTDILTFRLSDVSKPLVAEIYISIDRVRDNARHLKVDFKNELFRVMIHGLLHLCGYKDYSRSQKKAMRAKEDCYLMLFRST